LTLEPAKEGKLGNTLLSPAYAWTNFSPNFFFKIRYDAHEKLQNFMVPVPTVGRWHDEQIDELFASILGRGFEDIDASTTGEDGEEARRELDKQVNESLKGGFRVFG
jgi:protein AATF/BFR2